MFQKERVNWSKLANQTCSCDEVPNSSSLTNGDLRIGSGREDDIPPGLADSRSHSEKITHRQVRQSQRENLGCASVWTQKLAFGEVPELEDFQMERFLHLSVSFEHVHSIHAPTA